MCINNNVIAYKNVTCKLCYQYYSYNAGIMINIIDNLDNCGTGMLI